MHGDARHKVPLVGGAVIVLVWTLLGFVDARSVPWAGYTADGSGVITEIEAGSPAESAGLRVGDHVVLVGGVSTGNTRAMLTRPRPAPGQTETIEIERDGARSSVSLTWAVQPDREIALAYAGMIVGVCFVLFGLSAYLKAPSARTALLALTGIGLGLPFGVGPHVSGGIALLVQSFVFLLIFVAFGTLFHFVLSMPRPSAALEKRGRIAALYAPALLMGVLFAALVVAGVDLSGSALGRAIGVLFSIVLLAYLLGSLITVFRRWAKASGEDRARHGLTVMLVGTIAGIAPFAIQLGVGTVRPGYTLPGSDYLLLLFGLIPITFAMAAVRSARAQE